jgi:hypothetical protein
VTGKRLAEQPRQRLIVQLRAQPGVESEIAQQIFQIVFQTRGNEGDRQVTQRIMQSGQQCGGQDDQRKDQSRCSRTRRAGRAPRSASTTTWLRSPASSGPSTAFRWRSSWSRVASPR